MGVARFGYNDILKLLVKHIPRTKLKAVTRATEVGGAAALHFAAKRGDFKITNMLLKIKGDLTALDADQNRAVEVARSAGHGELANRLAIATFAAEDGGDKSEL